MRREERGGGRGKLRDAFPLPRISVENVSSNVIGKVIFAYNLMKMSILNIFFSINSNLIVIMFWTITFLQLIIEHSYAKSGVCYL